MATKKTITQFTVALGAAVAMLGAPAPAMAQGGLFDSLDPCIAAGETVSQNRARMQDELRAGIAKAQAMKPTPEFARQWWLAKRKALRPYFDANVLPKLPATLTAAQKDGAFKLWLEHVVAAEGGWAKVDALIAADWNRLRDEQIADVRASVDGALDQQDRDLRGQCPADFGNQALRGTLTLVMAPINHANQKLEIARREGTLLGQITAVTTGISLKAIATEGLLGGENSAARAGVKVVQPVVDVLKAPVNVLLSGTPFKL
jgi:hypothetical protein